MLREVHIRPVLNGFIVDVGCQTLVFPTVKKLVKALEAYYTTDDPDRMEKLWLDNSVNSHKLGPMAVPPRGLVPPSGGSSVSIQERDIPDWAMVGIGPDAPAMATPGE